MRTLSTFLLLSYQVALSNPYPDPSQVPSSVSSNQSFSRKLQSLSASELRQEAQAVLRVQVDWDSESKTFHLAPLRLEQTNTPVLQNRSKTQDTLGSYWAILSSLQTGAPIAFDSIGTGSYFQTLTRALTFRFPLPQNPVMLEVLAEDPDSGIRRSILRERIEPSQAKAIDVIENIDVRSLKTALASPAIEVVIYSEAYSETQKSKFWFDAQRVVRSLESSQFPRLAHFNFKAVFSPSQTQLGSPKNLGLPIAERKSFLGLYFPYWSDIFRWFHIVYPTRESKYRNALAQIPYDYPIVLVKDSRYWGVGNYREITAIPSETKKFDYLLLHEIGHYFGLNEEYESGGKTELAFSANIREPWSQNITFLTDPRKLKWKHLLASSTPVPTPFYYWSFYQVPGAYRGGYAENAPQGKSHKPSWGCLMSTHEKYCPICRQAIEDRIGFDLGTAQQPQID